VKSKVGLIKLERSSVKSIGSPWPMEKKKLEGMAKDGMWRRGDQKKNEHVGDRRVGIKPTGFEPDKLRGE